jgi:hypothetical protein
MSVKLPDTHVGKIVPKKSSLTNGLHKRQLPDPERTRSIRV